MTGASRRRDTPPFCPCPTDRPPYIWFMSEPAFICDDHLGKLARYLRLGGFDTAYSRDTSDNQLIAVALNENRYILTRDHWLIKRRLVRSYLLIESDSWPDQLRQVFDRFGLSFRRDRMLTRCLEDNTATEAARKDQIEKLVYPYTLKHHADFRQCPLCKRVYWSGSHVAAMIDRLAEQGFVIS